MISKTEAAESLKSVAQVQRRAALAKGYGQASIHLMLAGVVWAVGYTLTGLTRPEQWLMVWLPLIALNMIGSFAISYRGAKKMAGHPAAPVTEAARILWMAAAIMAFILTTYLLFHPSETTPYLAFPALVMGLVYVVMGAQGMPRFLWIGAAIFALTAAGLTLAPQAIAFWIAAAGGGGLFLGGLWLRQA
ncbi:MAG: hypothetical protein J7494_11430 [Sphingobium sp.]|nr:hypothetical protein [Sphingobium sp.]